MDLLTELTPSVVPLALVLPAFRAGEAFVRWCGRLLRHGRLGRYKTHRAD